MLAGLAAHTRLLLCLDYDGTLAEIAAEPALAVPHDAVRAPLARLAAARGRIAVAIVSGRPVAELRAMLALAPAPYLAGIHGLEFMRPDGTRWYAPETDACADQLAAVRAWLQANVPAAHGFLIEDKRVAIAFHFRNAHDLVLAHDIRNRLARFVAAEAPALRLLDGKKIAEVLPRAAGKHRAVELLCRELGPDYTPVYLGDDVTDEDAFAAIEGRGVAILVGSPRPTRAQYVVEGPRAVAEILASVAATVEAGRPGGGRPSSRRSGGQ
jgi:trehalose-phosphatase